MREKGKRKKLSLIQDMVPSPNIKQTRRNAPFPTPPPNPSAAVAGARPWKSGRWLGSRRRGLQWWILLMDGLARPSLPVLPGIAATGARPGCGRWPDWRRRGSHPVGGSPSVVGGSRGLVVLAVSLAARQQGRGRLVVFADLLPGSGGLLAVDSRRRWSSLSFAP